MIKINNISFGYTEKTVLENFSMSIGENEKICLFGESGCGKTTLLRLILGLEKPQKGEIIKGSYKASVVFQENLLLPFKSVLENITVMGADEKEAFYHLEELGIADYSDSLPDSLSGGMQRRVAIARALANDFDFLVLDEPFTGLDEENIKTAAKHILKIVGNRTIILVTHSKEEADLLKAKILSI